MRKEKPGKSIRISIPATTKETLCSVYAEGVSQGVFFRPERREYDVFLDSHYPIVLYFTIRTHRRLFVCAAPGVTGANFHTLHTFACTDTPLAVISVLRGRALDRFKRSLRFLCKHTDNRCHTFGLRFYWQLSYLAKNALNSNTNLRLLADRYDKERNVALFTKQREEA